MDIKSYLPADQFGVQRTIFVDLKKCIGCRFCEIACAVEHSSSKDLFDAINEKARTLPRIKVTTLSDKEFLVTWCRHCVLPLCATVCPVDAIKTDENGIVHVIEEKCIGCGACSIACPFNAISVNPFKKVAEKCDLCVDRIQKGVPPACVEVCPTNAIQFVSGREVVIRKNMNLVKARTSVFA